MVLEGTWDEILAHAPELQGHRVRVTLLDTKENGQKVRSWPPNERMLAAIREADELSKDREHSPDDDTLRLIREARAGAMYGDNPYE